MEELLDHLISELSKSQSRKVAVHNAVMDQVLHVPLLLEDYLRMTVEGHQRIKSRRTERLGGGAINFALVSSSLGAKGVTFLGFAGEKETELITQYVRDYQLDFDLQIIPAPSRISVVLEFLDGNQVFSDFHNVQEHYAKFVPIFLKRFRAMELSPTDWLVASSFYPFLVFPLINEPSKLFLDSGYSPIRREANELTALLTHLTVHPQTEFILGANHTEVGLMADELGVNGSNVFSQAQAISKYMSDQTGMRASILLHHSDFATVIEPDATDFWFVPTFAISPKRRTNAGDTFSAAFLCAYDSLGNFPLSIAFANLATAKRLCDDELPTPDNLRQFLKRAKLRDHDQTGIVRLAQPHLRDLLTSRTTPPKVIAVAAR